MLFRLMLNTTWLHLMLDTGRPGMRRRDRARGRGWLAVLVELSVVEQTA
jgi:hypothetical protein